MIDIQQIKKTISNYQVDKENKLEYGEVHTPMDYIEESMNFSDKEIWTNPDFIFYDSCAGIGNFSIVIIERLMKGLKYKFPDEESRYKHIVENQLFMVELQKESCEIIEKFFNPEGKYKLNLVCHDAADWNFIEWCPTSEVKIKQWDSFGLD